MSFRESDNQKTPAPMKQQQATMNFQGTRPPARLFEVDIIDYRSCERILI